MCPSQTPTPLLAIGATCFNYPTRRVCPQPGTHRLRADYPLMSTGKETDDDKTYDIGSIPQRQHDFHTPSVMNPCRPQSGHWIEGSTVSGSAHTIV